MLLRISGTKRGYVLLALFITFILLNLDAGLSQEQVFDVVISLVSTIGTDNNITIVVNEPQDAAIIDASPINFNFTISYNENMTLLCNLTISNQSWSSAIMQNVDIKTNNTINTSISLPNGNYNWNLSCRNLTGSVINSISKSFVVNITFDVSTAKEIYKLGEGVNITIQAPQNSYVNVTIKHPAGWTLSENFFGSYPQTYTIAESFINKAGVYEITSVLDYLAQPITKQVNFSIIKIDLTANETEIKEGESVEFTVDMEFPEGIFWFYSLNFGDGTNNVNIISPDEKNLTKIFEHKYSSANNYEIVLKLFKDANPDFTKTISITVTESNSTTTISDTNAPIIELLEPKQYEVINSTKIVFSYRAEDGENYVSNCTFELYNKTSNELIYNETNTSIKDGETDYIHLKDFSNGEYFWVVDCYDNASNYDWKKRYFSVELNSTSTSNNTNETANTTSAQAEENESEGMLPEAQEALDKINEFLVKMESFNLKEKEAVDDLGLSDVLEKLKQEILRTNRDAFNVKYRRDLDNEGKEKRRQELLQKIEDLKKKIPIKLEVIDSDEYVKYSISSDISDITTNYLEAENLVLDRKRKDEFIKRNKEVQELMTVSIKTKHLKIEYLAGDIKKITLVKKSVSLTNKSLSQILEVIPKDVAETINNTVFLVDYTIIKDDPIAKIDLNDLEENEIIYWIDGFVDLKKVKDSDTILLSEVPELKNSGFITGFAIFNKNSRVDMKWWLIAILIFALLLGYLIYGFDIGKTLTMKISFVREKEVKDIKELMNKALSSAKNNRLEESLRAYEEARESYSKLPDNLKSVVFGKMVKIGSKIDKAHIINLIKNCLEAINSNKYEVAHSLYQDIQEIYKKLPSEEQNLIFKECSIIFSKLNNMK
jgi:hypothetical protein